MSPDSGPGAGPGSSISGSDVELDSLDSAVELDSLDSAVDSAPDAPLLAPAATQPHRRSPRWLFGPRAAGRGRCARLVPRCSWTSGLCAAAAAYALACLARGVPLLACPLPAYTGAFGVGAIDVEVPLPAPRRIADTVLRASGRPAFELETVLFTLYYPVARGIASDLPRHPWVDRPVSVTAQGYARFAHLDFALLRPVFTFALWVVAGALRIPAEVDAPLLSRGDGPAAFPVMVFSHGMASSRTDYTHFLGELASRGHVVAAVEHRDGSCPGSLVKMAGRDDRRVLHFGLADLVADPPLDTPALKAQQLAFREAEIFETVRVLHDINAGHGARVRAANPRAEGATLAAWQGRLDLSRLVIGGHSYGATGALQALDRAASSDSPAVGGIILDPGKESGPLNAKVDVPLLVVHSNTWSRAHTLFYGRPHFDTVRDLVRAVLARTRAAWFLTSLGTAHPSVSDAPLIEPLLLSWTTGARLDVAEALRQYVYLSARFLDFLATRNATGLLAEAPTHAEYGKWVSEERRAEFPEHWARLWEIHVSPASEKQ